MTIHQVTAVERQEPVGRLPAEPVQVDALAPAAPDLHLARAGAGLDGSGGLVGRPLNHPTAGAARVTSVVALQRTHGNAHVARMLQPAAVRRQPRPAPPAKKAPAHKAPTAESVETFQPKVTFSAQVVPGAQAPGAKRGEVNHGHQTEHTIYKGDTLIVRAKFGKMTESERALVESRMVRKVDGQSGWQVSEYWESNETKAWRFRPTQVGYTVMQVGVIGFDDWLVEMRTATVVADLQDFSMACTQALADVLARFSAASASLNKAAKVYHEAYLDQESALKEADASERLVDDLLWGAFFAAVGGFAGGTAGGFIKQYRDKIKDKSAIGEGLTDAAKDLAKFATRSMDKLRGTPGARPVTSGDSTAPPDRPIASGKGKWAAAGTHPFEFLTNLAGLLDEEQGQTAGKLRDLIGQARVARDANSMAEFDQDPVELVNRDEALAGLTKNLSAAKTDYLRSLWHTWLENYAYAVVTQQVTIKGDKIRDTRAKYQISRKLKKQITRAAAQCGEDGDDWIALYAPKAKAKANAEIERRRRQEQAEIERRYPGVRRP
jgi:hypothetical protein